MFRHMWKCGGYLCTAVVAPNTAKSLLLNSTENTKESGWNRVSKIFSVDEFGEYTPELSLIYQTTVFTALAGACYGGFNYSRNAYLDFIEKNEASKYRSHFEAKKELQNYVTISFFKGAAKWSWRIALFASMYTTYVTVLAAYRGDSSIFDFIIGGLVSGAIFRINFGLPGIISGGTIGSLIGLTAGCMSNLIFRLSGMSFDDIMNLKESNNELKGQRRKAVVDKAMIDEQHKKMLDAHDQLLKELKNEK